MIQGARSQSRLRSCDPRDGFALGALDAARFLAGQPAKAYTMADLLD